MKVETIAISKITVGKRYRTDPGDLEGLAANINEMGLLEPIGIDSRYNLIFGWRRLAACHDFLQWKKIPCVILRMKSLLAGQYAENEFRKQFSSSERTAIGRAIEAELGNRKGQRSDFSAIAEKLPTGNTVDIAAKRAGFSSTETYQRAKTVTELGADELVARMDTGEVSVSAAAQMAVKPKEEQRRILAMSKEERREVLRDLRNKELAEKKKEEAYVFGRFYEAVKLIAEFYRDPKETWTGLANIFVSDFSQHLERAIDCLIRLKKEHPNAPRKPVAVP